MAENKYLTAPLASGKMPRGIPYILTNETAERFAYYGIVTILAVFLSKYLMTPDGNSANMSEEKVREWVHTFQGAAYFFPMIGALLADAFLGKFKTIILFSLIYCFGFVMIVINQTTTGIILALALLAIGTGMIKACVSANVGDQFGSSNKHLISKVYSWFYFAINLGAFVTSVLAPLLLARYGPKVAFGLPLVLMVVALSTYWLGRKKFVHIPVTGIGFVKETFSGEGIRAVAKLSIIYLFIAMFWSLFSQTVSAWVLQAENMNRNVFGREILSSQIQALNPLLVMIMIPLFSYVLYPAMGKLFKVTPLRKIAIGFFIAIPSFIIPAWIETQIANGQAPHIIWHLFAYILITAAEVMISITVLEFSYTQAPKKMKSFISSINLLSISLGNAFIAGVNRFIQNPDGTSKLEGADYYWFFTVIMAVTAVLFIFVAMRYKEKTYIQDSTRQAGGDVDQ